MTSKDLPKRSRRRRAFAAAAGAMLLAWGLQGAALAQTDSLAAVIGTWTADSGQDGLPLAEVTISQSGASVTVARKGADGSASATEFEPGDEAGFLIAEDSGTNPLQGEPVHWMRIGENGIVIHRLSPTEAGGLTVETEAFTASPGGGAIDYRRTELRDGLPAGEATGTLSGAS